jgi:hypothetical protein
VARVRRLVWTFVGIGAAFTIFLILFAAAVPLRSDSLKTRIVDTLGDRLNSDVSLEDLSLRLLPRLHVQGRRLLIRARNRPDAPPLIAIDSFKVDTGLLAAWRKHVASVELFGLAITIPPDQDDANKPQRPEHHRLHDSNGAIATSGPPAEEKPRTDPDTIEGGVVIDTLTSTNASLTIIPREADKEPKVWTIHALTMHNVAPSQAMPFDATLTNAVPPGEIVTKGDFGPWNRDNPGATPLDGKFTFDRADLGVFKGIAGTLESHGTFGGALNYIDVHGETDTPDFVIEVGGHPFPLHTTYHAIVDGTNGDTVLERIDAQFLQSTLVATGAVIDAPKGQHGRTVSLDITMPKARIEDVMTMAVKAKRPPMVGGLQLATKFLLPPGETDVVDRLRLNGRFTMSRARFTNREVQDKIVELSRRGRGKKEDEVKEQVASDFQGRFAYGDGRLALNDLVFAVPGAQVRLSGHYALKPETMAFKGNLLLDAKVSQTVGGFKSLLLKVVDPLFRREGGGSRIPIKIEGTRSDPKFGLDMGRVFKRGD